MKQCKCELQRVLTGREAEQQTKERMKYVSDKQGWVQLWRCKLCGAYWEMTWEGGGGFDNGVMTLRRLSPEKRKERWPEIKS